MVPWSAVKRDLIILILLGVANSAPIGARLLFKERFATPFDLGLKFLDKRPIFGPHKTLRGILASVLVTPLMAFPLGISVLSALKLSAYSMGSDLLTSFFKRRFGFSSGARATGLDQIPEALFPLLLLRSELHIGYVDIFSITFIFFVLEVLISPLLYALRIRRAPY